MLFTRQLVLQLLFWYIGSMNNVPASRRAVVRVQTGVRLEARLLTCPLAGHVDRQALRRIHRLRGGRPGRRRGHARRAGSRE